MVAKLLGISVGQLWGPNYLVLVWDNRGGQITWNCCGTIVLQQYKNNNEIGITRQMYHGRRVTFRSSFFFSAARGPLG